MILLKELKEVFCCLSTLIIEPEDIKGTPDEIGEMLAKASRGHRYTRIFVPKNTIIDEAFIVKYISNACMGSTLIAKVYYYE